MQWKKERIKIDCLDGIYEYADQLKATLAIGIPSSYFPNIPGAKYMSSFF